MFILASCGVRGERGEEDWTKGAQDYLSQRYTGDFQLLDSRREEGVTILTYQTQDELKLVFEVRCLVDGLDTPWGEFPLISQRKYTENFIQCLDSRLIGKTPVDVSGYSLDEMVELFQHTWERLNEAYGQYGADWVTPNFEMDVYYGGDHSLYPLYGPGRLYPAGYTGQRAAGRGPAGGGTATPRLLTKRDTQKNWGHK